MKKDLVQDYMRRPIPTPDIVRTRVADTLAHLPQVRRTTRPWVRWAAIAGGLALLSGLLAFTSLGGQAQAAIRSVFGLFRSADPVYNAYREQMEQYGLQTEFDPSPIPSRLPGTSAAKRIPPDIRPIISDVYYDGEQLSIGYRIEGHMQNVKTNYVPTGEELAEMERLPDDVLDRVNRHKADPDLMKKLDEAQAAGKPAGYIAHSAVIEDTQYTEDGIPLSPSTDNTLWADGIMIGTREYEYPLPDAVQRRDPLIFSVGFSVYENRYYFDGTHHYSIGKELESITVPISVSPIDQRQLRYAYGKADFPLYTADASLTVTPISTRAIITLTLSDEMEMKPGLSEQRRDTVEHIAAYRLLDTDGNVFPGGVYRSESNQEANSETLYLMFKPVPPDTTRLILRPVYSQKGVQTKEDIPLTLTVP